MATRRIVDWPGFEKKRPSKKFNLGEMTAFAISAMEELERDGKADFLLLKDDNLREWWTGHKAEEARKEAERLEKERIETVRTEALAKLSAEEREVLGLVPIKRNFNSMKESVWDEEDEDSSECDIAQWERDVTDDWQEV